VPLAPTILFFGVYYMKILKYSTFIGILAVLIFVFAIGCADGNRLSDTWVDESGWWAPYTFSGRNYSHDGGNTWEGTYSISGNSIEFLRSDGWVGVFSFSRTENTITIDGTRFIRRR
jgi:hypothetical protein